MIDFLKEIAGWWKESKVKAITAYLTFLFVLSIIPLYVYMDRKEKHELEEYGKFTIGMIEKITNSSRPYNMHIIYYVDSVLYKNVELVNTKYKRSKLFFVKFSSYNPETSIILYGLDVPKEVKEAPALGWDSIPSQQ